ncbi:hypothetical protein GO755_40340 [Spirosoma sp. HMF4905]|uniref:DUF4071 domain-containing protein n=1 Tax=Spirosoma arboris TaxID=2682092 RepID=A0A7K1SRJ1_9BACT|nr:tetratricopeptide repeat-containing protein [Spirosoma arboris]MVM36323.1 hypothetical protein [Spirosoma arboris]
MQAFIVRPFGTRKVLQKDKTGKQVPIDFDFERVQKELILPALDQAGLQGGTTGNIFEAGSIHEDMFSLLLVADLVVVDISIHNANVFYEMGIRHSLRDKRTVLIKCPGFDETPFDILGYRYIAYNKENPGDAIPDLLQALEETRQATRVDSPVFDKLPNLISQDPERFLVIPDDFEADLRVATVQKNASILAIMATEISGFQWYIPGLRQIGEALYALRCLQPARTVWEKIIEHNRNDLQANDRLATIYQRLAESEITANLPESEALFERSNIAIEKLLAHRHDLTPLKRAESFALKARNAKALWLEAWKNVPTPDHFSAAIGSTDLTIAFETYEHAFMECLNHFYSGINALGLLITTITLAERIPEVWELKFRTTSLAKQELEGLKEKLEAIKQSVYYSIEAGKQIIGENDDEYAWLKITEADFICLTETRPSRVKLSYQNALKGATNLNFDAIVRQLVIYQQLGVKEDNVKAALEALPAISLSSNKIKVHTILFTGHRIDQAGRPEPRFPPEKEMAVRKAIKQALQKEQETINGPLVGLAGGACGGDILFHEVCEELGIKTELYLALPRDLYIAESVAIAGPDWIDRFNKMYTKLPWKVLSQTKELPAWLGKNKSYSIWERNNLWLLNQALDNGGLHMSLIALWNGKGGDGPGGTEHMVKQAQTRGAKTIVIDINMLA